MALSTIVSPCLMNNKNDGLNPADRDYLDEYRHNSASLQLEVDSHLPSQSSESKDPSLNPYHDSFRSTQKRFLIQEAILKRQINWNWKKTAILTAVLALVATVIIVLAGQFAQDFTHGQYVQFFSVLILILFALCFLIVIGTRLGPWLCRTLLRKKNCNSVTRKDTLSNSNQDLTNVIVTVDKKNDK